MSSRDQIVLDRCPDLDASPPGEATRHPSIPQLWQELHRGERKALREFALFAGFQPLAKIERVSRSSMATLIRHGLALEGEASMYGPTFKLTPEGRRAAARLNSVYRVRPTLSSTRG
jgi:hypothetical protein